ncbi:hypothetical protein BOBR111200_01705 [Bordetella bronchialis]
MRKKWLRAREGLRPEPWGSGVSVVLDAVSGCLAGAVLDGAFEGCLALAVRWGRCLSGPARSGGPGPSPWTAALSSSFGGRRGGGVLAAFLPGRPTYGSPRAPSDGPAPTGISPAGLTGCLRGGRWGGRCSWPFVGRVFGVGKSFCCPSFSGRPARPENACVVLACGVGLRWWLWWRAVVVVLAGGGLPPRGGLWRQRAAGATRRARPPFLLRCRLSPAPSGCRWRRPGRWAGRRVCTGYRPAPVRPCR